MTRFEEIKKCLESHSVEDGIVYGWKGSLGDIAWLISEVDALTEEVKICRERLGPAGYKILTAYGDIRIAVDAQANDETLWCLGVSIQEAYMQQSLRWLHRVAEGKGEDKEALQWIVNQSRGDI